MNADNFIRGMIVRANEINILVDVIRLGTGTGRSIIQSHEVRARQVQVSRPLR